MPNNQANGTKRPDTAKRPPLNGGARAGTAERRAVGGRGRIATGTQRPAQGRGSGGMVFFVVAAVLAVGVGVGLAFKDAIFPPKKPLPPAVPVKPNPVKPVPPVKPVDPVKPPDTVKQPDPIKIEPVRPAPTPENGLAEKAIAEGRGLLAQLNYDGARGAFGRVDTMKCSADLRGEAAKLSRKADSFLRLTRDVTVRPEAGKPISIIETVDARTIRGVVTRNPDGSYHILTGGIQGDFTPAEVRSVKEVSLEEQRAEIRRALNTRVSRLGEAPSAPELYDAAVFAIENGLGPESLDLLERAWAAAEAVRKDLDLLVAEDQAGKYFAHASWSDSIGQEVFARPYCEKILKNDLYRKTSYGPAAEKLLALMDERKGIKNYKRTFEIEGPKTPPPVDPVKPPPQADPIKPPTEPVKPPPKVTVSNITGKVDLSEANNEFSTGLSYYRQGQPGSPNSKQNLAEASRHFRKAQGLYEAAVKADPGNSSLQSRMQDCNMLLYACLKHSTL